MALKCLIFIMPVALARIDVGLSGQFVDSDHSKLGVFYSGVDIGVITDKEKNTFGLNDGVLKDAVAAYFGRRPDDAYLCSPTPWGDLYKTYGWNQVQRTLVPLKGRILSITSQPAVILKQEFVNNSSKPATFDVGIHQTVENTVSSTWSKGGELSIGQDINYGFDIEVVNVGGTTSFSYTSSWGEETQKSQTVTVGSQAGMQILLEPGQAVVAELYATKGSVKLEMEYQASLSGIAAVNYEDGYRGHHFWSLDIGAVMASGKLSNSKISKEVISIGFYSESKVVVHDKSVSKKILEVHF